MGRALSGAGGLGPIGTFVTLHRRYAGEESAVIADETLLRIAQAERPEFRLHKILSTCWAAAEGRESPDIDLSGAACRRERQAEIANFGWKN